VDECLTPLSADLAAALALTREAVLAAVEPGVNPEEVVVTLQREVNAGRARGGLWMYAGRPVGIVLWEPAGPLGGAIRMSYLAPGHVSVDRYRQLFAAAERSVGTVAFTAPMPGLAPEEEARTLRSLGFAPFSRSEMRFPPATPLPSTGVSDGVTLRPVRSQDESELSRVHAAAFRDQFDRYLFLEDLDPTRDATALVHALFRGRWGEVIFGASMVAEVAARPVGETIVIRAGDRALIADIAVDPAHAGRGIGRSLIVATVRALRERGEATIALAVTEENHRAVRLYERVGFVRALGPTREWYNTRLIPAAPADG
jgi:ribosomal protein S18 acetylase RimI-like enzyme